MAGAFVALCRRDSWQSQDFTWTGLHSAIAAVKAIILDRGLQICFLKAVNTKL
jgi:hypothetical protein